MDRDGYAQLNRMEEKIDHMINGQKLHMNLDTVDTLEQFYESEIVDPEGELHYLVKDEKLKAFFENLVEEVPEDEVEEETEEKKFGNKPFN